MRVALTDVGRRGRLDLDFGVRGGQTVLLDSYCEVPFKITRTLSTPEAGVAYLMLMHCTAGLFGGDHIEMSVHVGSGAKVRLTQQSATRVHPSEDRVAFQSNRIVVDEGGELEVLLEAVIPFAQSRLSQKTAIEVAEGGRLNYWEGLMAGRIGRGESWAFEELSSETRLTQKDRLLFLDRFCLRPGLARPDTVWGMGAGAYMGSGLHVGTNMVDVVSKLHEALPDAGVDVLSDRVVNARVVTSGGPEFHHHRNTFGRICGEAIGV